MIKDYADLVQKLNEDPVPRLKDGIENHLRAYVKTGLDYDLKAVVELIDRLIREHRRVS